MNESALTIDAESPLIAIVTEPANALGLSPDTAVIILNAGLIHRVGPERLFVKVARRIAALGLLVVRFDHSAIGDTNPRSDNLPFDKAAIEEVRRVMDEISRQWGIQRFILAGLCSGAVTSLRVALADERVAAFVIMNGRGFDENPEWNESVLNRGRARWYWQRAIFSPTRWWRVVTGRIQYRKLFSVLGRQVRDSIRPPAKVASIFSRLAEDLRAVTGRGVRILAVFSEGDHGLDYLHMILGDEFKTLSASGAMRYEVIPGADHTFTLLRNQQQLLATIENWIEQVAPVQTQREYEEVIF